MSTAQECCNPCNFVPPVQIPGMPGLDGGTGAGGTPGINAYSATSTNFPIPGLVGGTATIPVNSNAMFAVGQIIFVSDGTNKGTFQITAKPGGGVTLTGTWLAYVGDSVGGTAIIAGALVVPGSTVQTILPAISNYQTGGAQAITNAFLRLLTLQVVLPTAGKYLLLSQVRLDLVAATFAASEEVSLKLIETANSNTNVPNAAVGVQTGIVTAINATLFDGPLPSVVYTAAAGDTIQMMGVLAGAANSGVEAISGSILAIKLF